MTSSWPPFPLKFPCFFPSHFLWCNISHRVYQLVFSCHQICHPSPQGSTPRAQCPSVLTALLTGATRGNVRQGIELSVCLFFPKKLNVSHASKCPGWGVRNWPLLRFPCSRGIMLPSRLLLLHRRCLLADGDTRKWWRGLAVNAISIHSQAVLSSQCIRPSLCWQTSCQFLGASIRAQRRMLSKCFIQLTVMKTEMQNS